MPTMPDAQATTFMGITGCKAATTSTPSKVSQCSFICTRSVCTQPSIPARMPSLSNGLKTS